MKLTRGSSLNRGNSIMCVSFYSSEDAIMTACIILCSGHKLQGFGNRGLQRYLAWAETMD